VAVAATIAVTLGIPGIVVLAVIAGLSYTATIWIVVAGAWSLLLALGIHAAIVAHRARAFEPRRAQSPIGYIGFIVLSGGLRLLAPMLLREHVIDFYRVPSESGRPNLDVGDHFILAKFHPHDRAGNRGDLVVFPLPDSPEATFVKRVVGRPGETVQMIDGVPVVDGLPFSWTECTEEGPRCVQEQPSAELSYRVFRPEIPTTTDPVTVPPGHVFVLGDNRGQSHDSSTFGAVPISSILGRAREIWFPFDRVKTLDGRESN